MTSNTDGFQILATPLTATPLTPLPRLAYSISLVFVRFNRWVAFEKDFFIKTHPAGVEYEVGDELGGFKVLDISQSKLHLSTIKSVERG
jgi:hypothetical protein